MITEKDLIEAIAECQGKRNPDASTCIKLAAFYTILDHIKEKEQEQDAPVYSQSFAAEPEEIDIEGDSEFARLVRGRSVSYIMPIIEELLEAVKVTQPRLYDSVIRRLNE